MPEASQTARPAAGVDDAAEEARQAVERFVAELQAGLDNRDHERSRTRRYASTRSRRFAPKPSTKDASAHERSKRCYDRAVLRRWGQRPA